MNSYLDIDQERRMPSGWPWRRQARWASGTALTVRTSRRSEAAEAVDADAKAGGEVGRIWAVFMCHLAQSATLWVWFVRYRWWRLPVQNADVSMIGSRGGAICGTGMILIVLNEFGAGENRWMNDSLFRNDIRN